MTKLHAPPISRRHFLGITGAAVAAPVLTESHLAWAAQQAVHGIQTRAAKPRPLLSEDAVLINANENPLGPCEAACKAIAAIAPKGGRYDMDGETEKLTETFAAQNHLKEEYVAVYAGSSEPLHYSVLAFTSPTRGFVTADPSYEAGMMAANAAQAKIYKVPLKPDYSHDLRAMVAADPNAGMIYVCNPNNPTGTLTAKEEIAWALEHKPANSILLVDEAYIHLSDAPHVLDFVVDDKDLIVLRTFSKVYGMAGIRCGLAAGRPDLLAKLRPYGMNAMPITGSAAANVSLLEPGLVPMRKRLIAETRSKTFKFLDAKGYKYIPSQSNCFMIDTGRDGKTVIAAMQAKNIYIGRTWPIWPNHVRVSVGTPEEMERFQNAFEEVLNSPPTVAGLQDPAESLAFPKLS